MSHMVKLASGLEVPSKSETGCHACPKGPRKPSISKVILGVMADKGVNSRVSLTFLRNALTTAGYNMTRNKRRFKRVVKGLVDKGILKRVTGRGTWGSFCMCKKHASKFNVKLKTKRRQQKQHRSRQHWSGQCWPRQRRLTRSHKQGHKWLIKEAHRVAKCHRN
uniref:H15 domain-containing protein n=1 Tax=Rhinolophus ferrumequinum TaxID=59479 RepID=A0A671GAZ5_RHIFE